jgi:type IV pilus assembly protein PilW
MIELMVAMLIGLIILAAVSTVLVSSKKNYTTQDSRARLQENARFAMQFLVRDLRMAGYFGCADDVDSVRNTVNGTAGSAYSTNQPIQGSESKSEWYPNTTPATLPPSNMEANTDAIAIRYLDGSTAVNIEKPYMNTSAAALHTSGTGLRVGEIVMVMDCSSAAVFQISGPGQAGDAVSSPIDHNTGVGTPGNAVKDLGKVYEGDAKIAKFYYASYYIRKNANKQPALYQDILTLNTTSSTMDVTPRELVEGIENLQILYGVNKDEDRTPDIYKKANAMLDTDWNNVVAIRFGILARTLANTDAANPSGKEYGTDIDHGSYDIDGDGNFDVVNPGDRYQRKVFQTTVLLRNLQ